MSDQAIHPNRLTWRTAAKRRRRLLVGTALWDTYFVSAIVLGLLLQLIFDGVVENRSYVYLGLVIGGYALTEVIRRLVVHRGALAWVQVWVMIEMFLRGGMLRGQVSSGGRHAGRPVGHAGAAMARFRDDPEDVAWLTDNWIDLIGAGIQAAIAIAIMASIDPVLTLAGVLPVLAIALTTRLLGHWVVSAHRRHLEAASSLTANLRDVFAAQDTIRLYAARPAVLQEVAQRSATRARAAVVDRVLGEAIRAASTSLSGVAIGITLLVGADELRSGELSIGDLALFVTYLRYMAFFPRIVGHFMTRHGRSRVAWQRMGQLAADDRPDNVVADFDLDIDTEPTAVVAPTVERQPLQRLTVDSFSSRFADGSGVAHAAFTIVPGTLTVVTGQVGAGKTTLLRAVLGLLPSSGSVSWNGREIDDLGAFMTPPHAAYLPQTPRLFSDTLRDNVELGSNGIGVDDAVALAGLGAEVRSMALGTDTMVGPRGVRLSGGQRQRLALARSLHRQPELLVLDDLSSAVDADTEIRLWSELRASGATILAVSNRPIAIEAADQVLTMVDGTLRH